MLQSGYRYALALTHHTQDAEDFVQEAWLNLSRRYGGVTSRAVLFTAIRNLFIDRCRRLKVVGFELLDDNYKSEAGPPLGAGAKDDLERLLQTLRPAEREAIFLHHIEGRTAEEIGSLTRRPRNTVLSLLHRAFQKLQRAKDVA